MVKSGMVLIIVAAVSWFLAVLLSALNDTVSILIPVSVFIGVSGTVLLFIGVLADRIKEKKEEKSDDLSKY